MRTSEVLNKAADLIEERGWTQGPMGMLTDHPSLCMEGAIRAAFDGATIDWGSKKIYEYVGDVDDNCPAGMAVRHYLGCGQPYVWNDDQERTAAEVIEVLRATAVIEAARETEAAEQPAEVPA